MKSVVKNIDWTKLPVDTRITIACHSGQGDRYFSSFSKGSVLYYQSGTTSKTAASKLDVLPINPSNMKLAQDQSWTVWQGGNCPIPDGLEFEYMSHGDPGQAIVCTESASAYLWQPKLIYAYRLTGNVLGGYSL
jgi:hypothetical protein